MDYEQFNLGDVTLLSGAILPSASIAYKTYGRINASGDNVILLPRQSIRSDDNGYFLFRVDDQSMVTKFYIMLYYKYFILLNFLLFRFFDIFKPFPIAYVDKNFKNSFGIIFDDILAGLCCVLFPYVIIILSFFFKFIGL